MNFYLKNDKEKKERSHSVFQKRLKKRGDKRKAKK